MSETRAISTTSRRELSLSFFFLQGKAPKEIHAILTETLDCFLPGRAKDLSAPLYLLLCEQCYTPDDGQRNCPKHVEFYSKNKFEELVHIAGFIIRIYNGARFSECQTVRCLGSHFNPLVK